MIILGTLVAAAGAVQVLGVEGIQAAALGAGPWGPLVWVFCLWLLLPAMAPVSVMTALTGLAFGPSMGFLSGYVGVVGGGWISFLLSRWMGRAWVEDLLGDRAARFEARLEEHSLFGVMYLRMLPAPFIPVSYLAGLTSIRFWPYAIGTAIGIVPGVLVNTVVAGTLGEFWVEGQGLSALWDPRTRWAAVVILASILGPFVIEATRRRLRPATAQG